MQRNKIHKLNNTNQITNNSKTNTIKTVKIKSQLVTPSIQNQDANTNNSSLHTCNHDAITNIAISLRTSIISSQSIPIDYITFDTFYNRYYKNNVDINHECPVEKRQMQREHQKLIQYAATKFKCGAMTACNLAAIHWRIQKLAKQIDPEEVQILSFLLGPSRGVKLGLTHYRSRSKPNVDLSHGIPLLDGTVMIIDKINPVWGEALSKTDVEEFKSLFRTEYTVLGIGDVRWEYDPDVSMKTEDPLILNLYLKHLKPTMFKRSTLLSEPLYLTSIVAWSGKNSIKYEFFCPYINVPSDGTYSTKTDADSMFLQYVPMIQAFGFEASFDKPIDRLQIKVNRSKRVNAMNLDVWKNIISEGEPSGIRIFANKGAGKSTLVNNLMSVPSTFVWDSDVYGQFLTCLFEQYEFATISEQDPGTIYQFITQWIDQYFVDGKPNLIALGAIPSYYAKMMCDRIKFHKILDKANNNKRSMLTGFIENEFEAAFKKIEDMDIINIRTFEMAVHRYMYDHNIKYLIHMIHFERDAVKCKALPILVKLSSTLNPIHSITKRILLNSFPDEEAMAEIMLTQFYMTRMYNVSPYLTAYDILRLFDVQLRINWTG